MAKCPVCGKELGEFHSDFESVEKLGKCFSCDIWENRLKELNSLPKDQHKIAIIDGTYYYIRPEDDPSPFRGFGGDKFIIHFKDGCEVITTNLWCVEKIDKYWQQFILNNADFDWEWRKIGNTDYLFPKGK